MKNRNGLLLGPTILPKTAPNSFIRSEIVSAMQKECEHLVTSSHFAKAPTLRRLLIFLVEQTLAGRGDELKSYTVAVEGLGRSPDFDSQIDSYPRVQIVRLRRLLESFYARQTPVGNLCIFLISGSYRVRLANLAIAYPELARANDVLPLSILGGSVVAQNGLASGTGQKESAKDPNGDNATKRPLVTRYFARFATVVLLLLAATFAIIEINSEPPKSGRTTSSNHGAPILLLEKVNAASDPRTAAIADDIFAVLADGIGRAWTVRLTLSSALGVFRSNSEPRFRLGVQLGEIRGGYRPLYVRLTEYETSQLLWAKTVKIMPGAPLHETLGQTIAQLTGPFGIVASRESRVTPSRNGPGYDCLLGYLNNVSSNDRKVHRELSRCLTEQNSDPKLDAVRLAIRSIHMLKAWSNNVDEQTSFPAALKVARQSVKADPKEASSHFAVARIYFISENCPMGLRHTMHAIELNPYDPVILAVLGSFATRCGYNEGSAILDKAYAFRAPGEPNARLSLILAAIWQHRLDRLGMLREEGEASELSNAAYHYLCETLIAAALDEQAIARSQWQRFRTTLNAGNESNDIILGRIILSPSMRAQVIEFLNNKNVL